MDTMRLGHAQFEILGQELSKLSAEMTVDMNKLFYPNGRQAAYDRLNAMCEVSPPSLRAAVDRKSNPYWLTRRF